MTGDDLIWGNLVHLSFNMWEDWQPPGSEWRGFDPALRFDETLWNDILRRMSEVGMNMVVLDLGDGRELNLIVEIKGYRREDAKVKKETMLAYWVPGVNNLREFGQWAFAELRDKHELASEFATIVDDACRDVESAADEG